MSGQGSFASQENKLLSMVRYAYENSPFYRRKFDASGIKPEDIKSLNDFYTKVPFTRKSELVESQKRNPPYGDFLAVPREMIRGVFVSPGPIYEPRTEADMGLIAESGAQQFRMRGITTGDIVQIALSYHFMPGGLFMHEPFAKYGCLVVPAGTGDSRLQVNVMQNLGTTIFVGMPSFLGRIADAAREMGVDCRKDLSLRMGMFGGEPFPPLLRKELEDTFGIEIFDDYGVAEVGQNISWECVKHNGKHISDKLLAEIINPKTEERLGQGETGELVVTHLQWEAMPLIRYRTGDGSILSEEPCVCGLPTPRLLRILGRVDMITKVRGVFVHPGEVYGIVNMHPELGRFQILIERPQRFDVMTVNVEYKQPIENIEGLRKKLTEELKSTIHLDVNVNLVKEGQISPGDKLLIDKRGESFTV